MIFDRLENFDKYSGVISPLLWRAAARFISEALVNTPGEGRYELLPDGELYASVQSYTTRPGAPDKLEAHRIYGDIQLLLAGEEKITLGEFDPNLPRVPYDQDRDIAFYTADPKGGAAVLRRGVFVYLAPGEGHEPGVMLDAPQTVIKAVIKLRN